MKVLRKIGGWIMLLLTCKGAIADEAAAAGVITYEGQGRDEYGR